MPTINELLQQQKTIKENQQKAASNGSKPAKKRGRPAKAKATEPDQQSVPSAPSEKAQD